jgi:cyanate permease
MLIGAFAPYLTGFVFDAPGSYSTAFMVVMFPLFRSSILATIMKRPGVS